VIAPSSVDAVRFAGGWLFDQVMSGWEATVVTLDRTDSRPLRILGADVIDLDAALVASVMGPRPQLIAVDAGLYDCDPRVRRMMMSTLGTGQGCDLGEVILWGGPSSVDQAPGQARDQVAAPVRHRLSVAATAFKAQALAAAAAPVESIEAAETFRVGDLSRATELMPAAR
jgi:hypothetical protein